MRDFEAKGELIEAALAVIPDLLEVHPDGRNSDAEAEYHDNILQEKATQYVRVLGLKVEDGYTPIEIENSIRNQIIGYMKGKVVAKNDEMVNVTDPQKRTDFGREIAAFETVAAALEDETPKEAA